MELCGKMTPEFALNFSSTEAIEFFLKSPLVTKVSHDNAIIGLIGEA
jgi:hypothetical protein